MDFPQHVLLTPPTIHSWSLEAAGTGIVTAITGLNSVAVVANRIYLVPFNIYEPSTTDRMAHISAATGVNIEMGLYNAAGKKVAGTPSTVTGTAAAVQAIAFAEGVVTLMPGRYYMAYQLATAGNAYVTSFSTTGAMYYLPLHVDPGASGLPASLTPVVQPSGTLIPFMAVVFDISAGI